MLGKVRTGMVEFEEKFFCQDKSLLIERLEGDGFEMTKKESEVDSYFTDNMGHFVNDRTYFRIRKKDDKNIEITYKDKTKDVPEKEIHHNKAANVVADIKNYGDAIKLFKILGYSKYVTVYKEKMVYNREEAGVSYNVIVEEIEGIGNFVEFEIISDKNADMNRIKEIFKAFVAKYKDFEIAKAKYLDRDYVARKLFEDLTRNKNVRGLIFSLNENEKAVEEIRRLLKLNVFKQLEQMGLKLALVHKSKTKIPEELLIKLERSKNFDLIVTKIGNEKISEVYDMVLEELKFVKNEVLILEEDAITCRVNEKQSGCFDDITQIALVMVNGSRLKKIMN